MSAIFSSMSKAVNRGISAGEVKAIFKKAAANGFTVEEAHDLRAAFTSYADSFTPAGRAEYAKQLRGVVTIVEAYARVTPTGPEKLTFIPSATGFGSARLTELPILLEGKPANLVHIDDGDRSSLSIRIPGEPERTITNPAEARALAQGLRANPRSAESRAYHAAHSFSTDWNFSTLTFRNARSWFGEGALNVRADDGRTFKLSRGVVTTFAGIASRELTTAEYASLLRAIPYNVSVDLNALYTAVYMKAR